MAIKTARMGARLAAVVAVVAVVAVSAACGDGSGRTETGDVTTAAHATTTSTQETTRPTQRTTTSSVPAPPGTTTIVEEPTGEAPTEAACAEPGGYPGSCSVIAFDGVTYAPSGEPGNLVVGNQVATLTNGWKVYEIRGEQRWFRIGVDDGNVVLPWQLIGRDGATNGRDVVDFAGVDTVVARLTDQGQTPVLTLTDPSQVAAVVDTVAGAPLVEDWASGPGFPGRCLFEFHAPGREPIRLMPYTVGFGGPSFLVGDPPERTPGISIGSTTLDELCPPSAS